MTDIEDINENDCCGNGCANCVLNIDMKKSKIADKTGKKNILNKYSEFRLLHKNLHSTELKNVNVWELHFKSRHTAECNSTGSRDFILDINPGYHLMMRTRRLLCDGESPEEDMKRMDESETKRKYLLRPYSPYWWDIEEMEFKILVNLKLQGPMSDFIRALQIDDLVEFRGPIGQFEYTADAKGDNRLLIITQGVAVAPVLPIIENILHNDDDLTRIIHLACFKNIEHIYFRNKLYEFQKFWNYKVHIYLAHELCDTEECVENRSCLESCKIFKEKLKYKEAIHPLRLTDEELGKMIGPLKNQLDRCIITLAGTGKFQTLFKDLLTNYGFKENTIYFL